MELKVGLQDVAQVPVRAKDVAEKKRTMPRLSSTSIAEIAIASVLMAVGALVISDAVRMGFRWGAEGPQSGFFPFWLGAILILASAGNIMKAVRQPAQKQFVSRQQLGRVLRVVAPAAGMIALIPFLGLYVASALYMGVCMRWLGRHSWIASLAAPVVIALLTFYVFEKWFLLPLPKGPLEAWLGY